MSQAKIKLDQFFDYYRKLGALDLYTDYLNNQIISAKSGIKIKKLNIGKFTEYCKGKVTDECINRAKSSGNSKLIKRATFAENAKKWKH